ncbi:MAG: LysR family transcriptional regulator [Halopseudomonas sp.]|uniref:LysR family transcriptional regulator n=1 Tax=Halopseudomonas sp. TaxID=2901191 RepID=UPI003002693C
MHNRIQLLRIFCSAAEASSFREAASRLGTSPQTVTRAVQELEELLGEPLFHRNTRQIHITGFGESMALQAREALATVDGLFSRNRHAAEAADSVGRVGIAAPHAVGRRFLLALILPLLRAHPGLQLDIRLDDEPTDVVGAQIDVGVRIGGMQDRSYIARAVAPVGFMVVASPGLLAQLAPVKPQRPTDLLELPLSVVIDRRTGKPWPWMFRGGENLLVPRPAFSCDDAEAELAAVLAGLAIGQVPTYLALPCVQAGQLVPLLDAYAPAPIELYVYRPQRGPISARVRLVYEHLRQALADPRQFPQ